VVLALTACYLGHLKNLLIDLLITQPDTTLHSDDGDNLELYYHILLVMFDIWCVS